MRLRRIERSGDKSVPIDPNKRGKR